MNARTSWSCIAIALLLGSLLPAATVIDDFENASAVFSGGASIQPRPAAGDASGGHALALTWPTTHGRWIETARQKPLPLPVMTPESATALTFSICVPATGITSVAVRLCDASHEIFQWSATIAPTTNTTWRTVCIPLDLAHPQGHWGGDNNGRVDGKLSLIGFSFLFSGSDIPAGTAWIDDVALTPIPTAKLVTDHFPFLVAAHGAGRCELVVSNPDDAPATISITGQITDLSGAATPVSGQLTVPAHGEAGLPLPLGTQQPGFRRFTYTLALADGSLTGQATFVIGDPAERDAPGGDGFLFGICSHPEHQPVAEQEPELAAMAAAGASVARISTAWASLEPQPGIWHWDVQDRLVELAATYGIETQPTLGFGPAHAVSAELRAAQAAAYAQHDANAWKLTLFAPPEEQAWRRYVVAMVSRYRGRIRFYEVWNEPDLGFWRGTTDEYLALLRAASQELHRTDPLAKLLTGGFATVLEHAGRARNPDLQERVLAEAADAFDIHALHQHGSVDEFQRALAGEVPRLRTRQSIARPLLFNETAISSIGLGERAQAVILMQKIVLAQAYGAIGYTWYDLRDDGNDPGNPEHHFGLLNHDFQPKPAFATFREAVRQLHGLRPLGRLAQPASVEAPVFGNADRRVVAWWCTAPWTSGAPIPIMTGAAGAHEVDLQGTVTELPSIDGMVLVQPTALPRYLVLPPGAGLPEIREPLVAMADATAVPGCTTTVQVTVVNPLARSLTVTLSWRGPTGESTTDCTLPAHGRSVQTVLFPAPRRTDREQPQALSWSVHDTRWRGVIERTVAVTFALATAAPDQRAPDWVLDQRSDLVDLCQADPALLGQAWRGPADLSAQVWAWFADNALHLRIAVRDDHQISAGTADPTLAWRGDGVQIGLRHPGSTTWYEIGAALAADGTVMRSLWSAPPDAKITSDVFTATATPRADGVTYEVVLPATPFALDATSLTRGVQLNLVINDNDGAGRKAFMRLAPGLGERKDPSLWPLIAVPR